jgi:uncharacterized phage protein gp47/JayE
MLSLDDLTRPISREDFKKSIYDGLATVGVTTTTWKPGAVVRTLISIMAVMLAALSALVAKIARSGYLELSEGAWLTIVAYFGYGVKRIEPTFATGVVVLNNSGGGIYNFDADDLVFFNPATRKQYRNTAAGSVGALETGVVVPVQAVEAGSASTAAPGTIVQMETPLLGVSVTNPLAVVGSDAEPDTDLRLRCKEKTAVASPNGPQEIYAFLARSARRADGSAIGINRVKPIPNGAGDIDVYVATPTGGVIGNAEDPSTDLGAVNDSIQRWAAPLAVTVRLHSATKHPINVKYEVWAYDTIDIPDATLKARIAAKLLAFLPNQPIGGSVIPFQQGKIYADALRTAIGSAHPEIFHTVLTTPGGDLTLSVTSAPVAGAITAIAINRVPRGNQ